MTTDDLLELILAPFAIGYAIVVVVWRIIDALREHIFSQKEHTPTKEDLERMAMKIERQLAEEIEARSLQAEEKETAEETEQNVQEETPQRLEKPEDDEFLPNKNFYLERKLTHRQKESMFAHGYKRLKISPYGDSGASYYWVKTRYNESKEHAFFCYLIERELRKYTREIELFTNNGPDVILRHANKVYCFDVETGKNLIRKPQSIMGKFLRYKEEYFRSYIFVTKKVLKRKYKKMGVVITRSTFRKIISGIFS